MLESYPTLTPEALRVVSAVLEECTHENGMSVSTSRVRQAFRPSLRTAALARVCIGMAWHP